MLIKISSQFYSTKLSIFACVFQIFCTIILMLLQQPYLKSLTFHLILYMNNTKVVDIKLYPLYSHNLFVMCVVFLTHVCLIISSSLLKESITLRCVVE